MFVHINTQKFYGLHEFLPCIHPFYVFHVIIYPVSSLSYIIVIYITINKYMIILIIIYMYHIHVIFGIILINQKLQTGDPTIGLLVLLVSYSI